MQRKTKALPHPLQSFGRAVRVKTLTAFKRKKTGGTKSPGRGKTHTAPKKSASEAVTFYYEFQWRTMTTFVDIVKKGAALYITLFVAIIGFLITAEFPEEVNQRILNVITTISIIVLVIIIVSGYGIFRGAKQLCDTVSLYNAKMYKQLGIDKYFQRAYAVTGVLATLCLAILYILTHDFVLENMPHFVKQHPKAHNATTPTESKINGFLKGVSATAPR